MRQSFAVSLAALLVAVLVIPGKAETEEIRCTKSATFLAPTDSLVSRKYAPDYQVKMMHLALDVTPDFRTKTVEGKATLTFRTLLEPVQELKLDALTLRVKSLTGTEKVQGYQATDEHVVVTFAQPVPASKEVSITIVYSAEPKRGLYFRTPEMGYKSGDTHLFTQGEEIEGRNWYPCLDAPSSMFTSEITCRVPEDMAVISNGRLISESKDTRSGLKAVHWSQEKPHANYLITLVAGHFKKLQDNYRNVPLVFYTLTSEDQEAAASSFRGTRDMMAFFEEEIGVAYPWPKYDQVCVNDFVAGGMENTSATTLTDSTLFRPETENIHTSEGLVAHELAHQWFGDLVTCKDWSHIWLNEGFATYYEALYQGHKHGRDSMLYELWGQLRMITGVTADTAPIVRRTFDKPGEMFGYRSYQKGGWVLHMLRAELGEDLYRKAVKLFLERYRHRNAVTENLRTIVEELSGRSFDQFFDQWLYHSHHPELDVTYDWDEARKLATLSVKQVQKVDENVLLFHVPLKIRFNGKFGQADRTIRVSKKEEAFSFSFKTSPELVRLDPDLELLARINFSTPNSMGEAQLTAKGDAIGRILAVEQLGKKGGADAIKKLGRILREDGFYGVRVEASQALRGLHTDEALEALLASTEQPDARVRRQVTSDIGGFYRETAYAYAASLLEKEKNPHILGVALRSIAGYGKPEVKTPILTHLRSKSYRNQLAGDSVAAARLQDDPDYIQPLMQALCSAEADFTSWGLGQALSAVAYLARNEENKEAVRKFLLPYVNSQKRSVQLSALQALGTLGDTKAIAVLEKFATADKGIREREAAEGALRLLRAGRRPVDDFKNLRDEVLELQKTSRELRKELDELKKQSELKPAAPVEP
jgi:aminopeptidase N